MAARLQPRHQDAIKAKIKVGNIINRLEKHINGLIEMTPSQVTSAKILLDKTMSNAPSEIKGAGENGEHLTKIEVCFVKSGG